MFTREGILKLHGWTHNSLDLLLAHCAGLPFELLTQELAGFGFNTVRGQLVHSIGCEAHWVWKLEHRQEAEGPQDGWRPERFSSLEQIEARRAEVRADTIKYVNALTDAELEEELLLIWPGEGSETGSRAFYLQHLLTHYFHHKGQIVAMCRLLGQPCPDTDLRWEAPRK